jgi:hypothetical protein
LDWAVMRLELCRSTTPSVAVMPVVGPVAPTQCAAVSTTLGRTSEPPHPIDSRTIQGNSPCAAGVPPTTRGWTSSASASGAASAAVARMAPSRAPPIFRAGLIQPFGIQTPQGSEKFAAANRKGGG